MQALRAHSALALLGLLLALCTLSATSQPDLRYRRVLQRARAAAMGTQDWSKRAMEDILAQLAPPEGVEDQASTADESEDGHMELERSVENNAPRERKAGCKNFFWKGPTSC